MLVTGRDRLSEALHAHRGQVMDRQLANAGILQALAPVLAQALRQRGLGHLVLLGQITRHWHAIAGPQLAAVTQPESIRARVLFITVSDAIWLQQDRKSTRLNSSH